MAFEVHSDIANHPVAKAAGAAGIGLWVLCGTWTSANGETGVVPREVAESMGSPEIVAALVKAGLWTDLGTGFRMEYGPTSDGPLPLWRYGDEPVTKGRLFEVVRDPEE
jgi:hypothetical protein